MKAKYLILVLLLVGITFSQSFRKHDHGPRERMEQLEQIKLLEVLDLDEETSVRFIVRRNEFKDNMSKLMDEREALIFDMEQALKKGKTEEEYDYKNTMDELALVEKKFVDQRKNYMKSLDDLLTIEQTAKLIVFESKFMREVRDALSRKRDRNPMEDSRQSDNRK